MANQLSLDLSRGPVVRITRLTSGVDITVLNGVGLQQRIVLSRMVALGDLRQHPGGLLIGNAILPLADDEASALFAFLRLAGWKA